MADRYVSSERVGWGSRIMESIKGVLIGILLVLVSFPLLWWNEGRAVERYEALGEGRGAVVEANPGVVDPSHEGMLVHLTGSAETVETLRDAELGVEAPAALRLRRSVEMYQWTEETETRREKQTGGSERRVTTTTYSTEWETTAINSAEFDEVRGHQNPPMRISSQDFDAANATVGARTLTPALVSQLTDFMALPVAAAEATGLGRFGGPVHADGAGLYVGANPATAHVGDLRVRWEIVTTTPVSVLAAQSGPTFVDWPTPSGDSLEQNLEVGVVGADQMFGNLEAGNAALTWFLRALGWLFMFIGLVLTFRPLTMVADVIPFIGSLVGAGSFLAALVISVPLSFITMAVSWIVYRPLIGIGLLVVGLAFAFGVGFFVRKRGKAKNAARRGAPAPAPAAAFGAAPAVGQAAATPAAPAPAQPLLSGPAPGPAGFQWARCDLTFASAELPTGGDWQYIGPAGGTVTAKSDSFGTTVIIQSQQGIGAEQVSGYTESFIGVNTRDAPGYVVRARDQGTIGVSVAARVDGEFQTSTRFYTRDYLLFDRGMVVMMMARGPAEHHAAVASLVDRVAASFTFS